MAPILSRLWVVLPIALGKYTGACARCQESGGQVSVVVKGRQYERHATKSIYV